MNPILLKRLAQISTGFTIRESIDYLDYGEVKAIQLKDLPKDDWRINTHKLTGIEWRYDSQPQYLPHQAILLTARGEPSAYLFTGSADDKVVASNPFIIIHLLSNKVLPAYLVWYLNYSTVAQKHFAQFMRGNSLPLTSIVTVKELPVIIPNLQQQQEIINTFEQVRADALIFKRLIQLRKQYHQLMAENILSNTVQS